jgi:hypothetical protein
VELKESLPDGGYYRGPLFSDVYNSKNRGNGFETTQAVLENYVTTGLLRNNSFLYHRLQNGLKDGWISEQGQTLDEKRFYFWRNKNESNSITAIPKEVTEWLHKYTKKEAET